jgi:hypothetical protein
MVHLVFWLGIVLWFILTGLLWYAKPNDTLWLFGSLGLGAAGFGGIFLYVTRT